MDPKSALLIEIARTGAASTRSTTELARTIRVSQQSVSRILKQLESAGMIRRKLKGRGQALALTEKGKAALKSQYGLLQEVFGAKPIEVSGTVFQGMGEGKYYMALPGYKSQFRKLLGYEPYPGTLNLKVDPATGQKLFHVSGYSGIKGFRDKKRTFGGLKCRKVAITAGRKRMDAAVIFPDRTSYGAEVVEIIAARHIRTALKLKEGSAVQVTVEH